MNVCCWEIGLLSAAMALVVEPPAIGQVSLSEYQVGTLISGVYLYCRPMTSMIVLLETTNKGSEILCHRYVVEEGDTLAGIALRYQTWH